MLYFVLEFSERDVCALRWVVVMDSYGYICNMGIFRQLKVKVVDHAVVIAVLMMALSPAYDATAQPDCSKMRNEAFEFIRGMPADLQGLQELAVRMAMAGDVAALEVVRNSRNKVAELPEDVSAMDIEGKYRLYMPAQISRRQLPVLIYLHGGGWCFGSINSCARFCSEFVKASGIAVLAVDYPLAPECPYPAALGCCMEAVNFVYDNAAQYNLDKYRISIGGDSAGGNLALATALGMVVAGGNSDKTHAPCLDSLILFYPVVKAWNDNSDSWQKYGNGYGLDSGIMEAFNEAYIGENDPASPLISPFCAEAVYLAQLPPVLIVNADHDILRDQGADMYAALVHAGVRAYRKVLPGTTHLFITVPGQSTAFREAVRLSAEFIRNL